MVGRNTSVFVCVLAVLLSISNVDAAFKCYECNSATDSRCSDEFHKSSNLESTTICLGCSKSKLNGIVTRACSPVFLGNKCEESDGNTVCICERELCNASTTLAVSMAVLLGVTLAVFFPKI